MFVMLGLYHDHSWFGARIQAATPVIEVP